MIAFPVIPSVLRKLKQGIDCIIFGADIQLQSRKTFEQTDVQGQMEEVFCPGSPITPLTIDSSSFCNIGLFTFPEAIRIVPKINELPAVISVSHPSIQGHSVCSCLRMEDRVIARPHPKFLSKVVSNIHNQSLHLLVFFPNPHFILAEIKLHIQSIMRALSFLINQDQAIQVKPRLFVTIWLRSLWTHQGSFHQGSSGLCSLSEQHSHIREMQSSNMELNPYIYCLLFHDSKSSASFGRAVLQSLFKQNSYSLPPSKWTTACQSARIESIWEIIQRRAGYLPYIYTASQPTLSPCQSDPCSYGILVEGMPFL